MPYYNMVLVMECGQNMKIGQIVLKACCWILQSEFLFLHLIIIMHAISVQQEHTYFATYMLYECKQSLDI